MQPTCNTRATHVQHNVQHEHFCCKFLWFSRDGVKFAPFPFEVALGRRKWPESHFDCKFTGKVVVLHVVLHVCCTCVARPLHGNFQSIVWTTWKLARIPHWNLENGKPTPDHTHARYQKTYRMLSQLGPVKFSANEPWRLIDRATSIPLWNLENGKPNTYTC